MTAGSTAVPVVTTTNVLMAGVGGQGVLLASETLALAALSAGLSVKQSEVHGVAQRGGSVVSHVRFGARVHSPLVRTGTAHVLYASERLEALRYAHALAPGGAVVMDNRAIRPILLPGAPQTDYPDDVAGFLRSKGVCVIVVDAVDTAVGLGDKRCANVVLLGALANRLPLGEDAWAAALEQRFPAAALERNRRAFAAGRAAV
jgi:indolepyruvate ferredoxin oxidoreductase beta subunit